MESLDEILSGKGGAMPEPGVNAEQPSTPEAEAIEPGQGEQEGQELDLSGELAGDKTVPLKALHEERAKVKRYTEQVAEFEKKLSENDAKWEQRFSQLLQTLQPQQAKQEEQQPVVPEIWDDPNAFLQYGVQQAISPIQQQLQFNARLIAGSVHGQDKVDSAIEHFDGLLKSGQLDPADYQKVMQSPNPFHEAVQWHQRRQAIEEASNPEALREKLKAEMLAELQAGKAPTPAVDPQAMPSNIAGARSAGARTGSVWAGPPTLDDIFKR